LPYHFTFSPIKCKKKKKYGLLETGQFGWMWSALALTAFNLVTMEPGHP
jgi:hypothetical protein